MLDVEYVGLAIGLVDALGEAKMAYLSIPLGYGKKWLSYLCYYYASNIFR